MPPMMMGTRLSEPSTCFSETTESPHPKRDPTSGMWASLLFGALVRLDLLLTRVVRAEVAIFGSIELERSDTSVFHLTLLGLDAESAKAILMNDVDAEAQFSI